MENANVAREVERIGQTSITQTEGREDEFYVVSRVGKVSPPLRNLPEARGIARLTEAVLGDAR